MMNEKKFQYRSSIEDASIIRKFTILFLIMSMIPMMVICFFYYEMKEKGSVQMNDTELNVTLWFIVLGVVTGYIAMRSLLGRFVKLTETSHNRLKRVLDERQIEMVNTGKNEIDTLTDTFDVVTTQLEEHIKSLEITKRTLQAVMSKVGQGLSNAQNIDSFLELIIETITDALNGHVGVLMLYDKDEEVLTVKAVYGARYDVTNPVQLNAIKESAMYKVLQSTEPVVISDLSIDMTEGEKSNLFLTPAVCAPLISADTVHGVVAISGGNIKESFGEDELSLLLHIASQTAVAIENSRLSQNIESTYFETISALALAVDAKDKYSRGHLDRVATYVVQIAEKLGLGDEDIKTLRDAARLHDLGKIGIPDSCLKKEGPLSEDEWSLMKKHPEMGESIIKPISTLNHLCDIIRHHHEKLDGSGYPDGLKGKEISQLVRITTVADIYDALTTNRSYRSSMTPEKAIEVMRDMKDQLDQSIVEAFVTTLSLKE